MQLNTTKYHISIRTLHWLMAAVIICLIAVGLIMGEIPREDPMRGTMYSLHKSFGVFVFFLVILRVFFRFRYQVPALPNVIPEIERKLAKSGHYIFYFFMFAMPLSGYLTSNYFGFGVNFFGITLPKIVGIDKELGSFFAESHETLAYILILLIFLHIGGVIKHYIKDKTNLLTRMR
ncbi:MAG: cytochrome b [Pseudomonadota bacterium]